MLETHLWVLQQVLVTRYVLRGSAGSMKEKDQIWRGSVQGYLKPHIPSRWVYASSSLHVPNSSMKRANVSEATLLSFHFHGSTFIQNTDPFSESSPRDKLQEFQLEPNEPTSEKAPFMEAKDVKNLPLKVLALPTFWFSLTSPTDWKQVIEKQSVWCNGEDHTS